MRIAATTVHLKRYVPPWFMLFAQLSPIVWTKQFGSSSHQLPNRSLAHLCFFARSLCLAVVAMIVSLGMGFTPVVQAAACTGGGITGTTFRDYNANGAQDAAEPGLAGIVITVYDADGGTSSCESTVDGTYGIDPIGAYPVRLEFTLPVDGSMDFLQPGAAGSLSRTSVTFVGAPTANVSSGFSAPADFCGANPAPMLATSCFVFGEQNDNVNGVNKDRSVMMTFPYTAGSSDLTNNVTVRSPLPTQLAVAKSIGSVWGLAWNPHGETLYAAAFLKRHAGFGPSGPGAIYQITAAGASLFYDFGPTTGLDPHPAPNQNCTSGQNLRTDNANCWLHDPNAFDLVGKIGFGDLDISDDLATLYTINLADKTLLAMPIANPGTAVATAVPTPPTCPAVDVQPFGLGVKDGKVYVGMVCSGESTQNRAALRAYVYAFAKGAFAPMPALEIDLTYNRGSGNLQWQYWLNRTTFNRTDSIQAGGKWAQPWLTDIVFDGDDMVLGLRDRNADQFGSVAGGPDPSDTVTYTAFARGDILRACADGSGGWQLEANGSCGGVTTSGAGNGQGPGGGEYYPQDQQTDPLHSETSLGGHVQIPGLPDVVTLVYNPIEANDARSDGGVKWFNNQTGLTSRGYLLFDGSGEVALFDKANGLGDLEALCTAAPLEIGNRVWRDSDGDGVQDPAEPGLDGVLVELYRDGVLVGTTTTANGGDYLFHDGNVNLNDANGILAGLCGPTGEATYEVRIPNVAGSSQQPPLAGLYLTQAGTGGDSHGELRDSNGMLAGVNASYAIPCSDLSAPGFNNHTYDFGFTPLPAVELVAIGNLVFVDFNNNGRFEPDTGETGVANALLSLFVGGADPIIATPVATTTTNVAGFYLFDNLTPGQYFVHLHGQNFQPGGILANYLSSTGNGVSDSADDTVDENGVDNIDLATNGIRTIVYDLQPNNEPTAEAGTGIYSGALDDDNVNFTADLGVYKPLSLGNRVWLDNGAGGGGPNNGILDGAEAGIENVLVHLLDSVGNPVLGADGQPLTTLTDDQGYYIFTNLLPGLYTVWLDASNFGTAGPLRNLTSSEPTEILPDGDGDLNDNGLNETEPTTRGIFSGVVTLDYNSEPIDEADLGPVGVTQPPDTNNLTVDFGFWLAPTALDETDEPMRLMQLYLPAIRR